MGPGESAFLPPPLVRRTARLCLDYRGRWGHCHNVNRGQRDGIGRPVRTASVATRRRRPIARQPCYPIVLSLEARVAPCTSVFNFSQPRQIVIHPGSPALRRPRNHPSLAEWRKNGRRQVERWRFLRCLGVWCGSTGTAGRVGDAVMRGRWSSVENPAPDIGGARPNVGRYGQATCTRQRSSAPYDTLQ